MTRKLISTLMLSLATTGVWAETYTVDSTITNVSLYRDHAVMSRQAQFNLPFGEHTIIFKGLSANLTQQELTARGSDNVNFGDITVADATLSRDEKAELKKLKLTIDAIDHKLATVNAEKELVRKKKEIADKISANPLDAGNGKSASENLEILEALVASAAEQEAKIKLKQNKLGELRAKKMARINEINNSQDRQAKVKINVTNAGLATISLDAVTYQANWKPKYTLWLQPQEQTIKLGIQAEVTQQSGTNWENVSLEMINSTSDANESQLDLLSADSIAKNNTFTVPHLMKKEPYSKWIYKDTKSIPSDGSSHLLTFAWNDMQGDIYTQVFNAVSPSPYRYAVTRNDTDIHLPKGEAKIRIGDRMVGQMTLPSTRIGEKIKVNFGRDEDIRVNKETLSQDVEKIGDTKKRKIVKYRVSVGNASKQPKVVRVLEKLPQSTNASTEVLVDEQSLASFKVTNIGLLSDTQMLPAGKQMGYEIAYAIVWDSTSGITEDTAQTF